MACSCPQCTARPTDREAYMYQTAATPFIQPQREDAVFHPTLGQGRRVAVQGEVATMEPPSSVFHPTLGPGQRVRMGTASELELIGIDERQQVTNTTEVPFRWVCHITAFFPDPENPGFELVFGQAGSGTLISPRHVITAGHVILNDFTLSSAPPRGSRPAARSLHLAAAAPRSRRALPQPASSSS